MTKELTVEERARLRGWLVEVEEEAVKWGDRLDPERSFKGGGLVGKIDAIRRLATDTRYYLGGKNG